MQLYVTNLFVHTAELNNMVPVLRLHKDKSIQFLSANLYNLKSITNAFSEFICDKLTVL